MKRSRHSSRTALDTGDGSEGVDRCAQLGLIDVFVDLGAEGGLVAQKPLDDVEVRAPPAQFGRRGVTEHVRGDPACYAGSNGEASKLLRRSPVAHRCPERLVEE